MPLSTGGTPLSGKLAKVRIAGAILYQSEWDVSAETTWEDASNAEGQGYEQQVACLHKCDVTISGWWNGSANMHDAPLGIVDGTELTNVRIYIYDTAGPYWHFPYFDVKTVKVMAKTASKVLYQITGKAQGSFNPPAGNVA